jgi:imidazole glycerol-phosphate synthase subunit HisH
MYVGIIDLGINNLTSVQKAFSIPLKSTDSILTINDGNEMKRPDLVILPGLGKFGSGMASLQERNLVEKLKKWHEEGTKIVGICLGMQLLGTESTESKGVEGLNLINARIQRLPDNHGERIPHTGWAETINAVESMEFQSLGTKGDFYFVHSYQMIPSRDENILTTTPFGNSNFVSSIISANILGVQFHPEKSGPKGKLLITEIVDWARVES